MAKSDTSPYTTTHARFISLRAPDIERLKVEKGLALVDIVRSMLSPILKISLAEDVKAFIIEKLADIEYVFACFVRLCSDRASFRHRLAFATHEKLQLGSLVGTFLIARAIVKKQQQTQQAQAMDTTS